MAGEKLVLLREAGVVVRLEELRGARELKCLWRMVERAKPAPRAGAARRRAQRA